MGVLGWSGGSCLMKNDSSLVEAREDRDAKAAVVKQKQDVADARQTDKDAAQTTYDAAKAAREAAQAEFNACVESSP